MRVNVIFENCDYEALDTARELASKIYLSAEDGSDAERIAKSAVDSIADLLYFMSQQDEECAPCAGDCAECHCEECVEGDITEMIAKIDELLDDSTTSTADEPTPKATERAEADVTVVKGEALIKALAEIFGA